MAAPAPRSLRVILSIAVCLFGWTLARGAELPSSKDTWLRVQTANFTLYGNAGEGKIREVGLTLERLRAVLLLLTQKLSANAPVPTTVYVFKNDASLKPYKPLYQGKPANVGGFFLPTEVGNVIALTAAWNSDPRPLIYHEYLHFFLQNNFPPVPRWYDEGLAEFYSTFQANDSEARIGLTVDAHIGLLREVPLMPMEKLFAVTYDSPEYNEELKQGIFYAQSWAFVHYLMRGAPERKPQLVRFLQALNAGTPPVEAFHASFQMEPAQMLAELLRYIRGSRFLYTVAKFSEMKIPTGTTSAKVERPETLVRLGDLLAQLQDRLGDAEEHFRAVLSEDALHAGAQAGMAEVRMQQGREREALELYGGALAAGSQDFRVPYRYGDLLMRSVWERWNRALSVTSDLRDDLKEARGAFEKSIDRNPEFVPARAALGRTFLYETGGAAAVGIPHLEAAVRGLPSRRDLATDLATLYEQAGQQEKADGLSRRALGPESSQIGEENKKQREFNRALEQVDELVMQRKEGEALALMERLVQEAPADRREELQRELMILRVSVEDIRAVNRYNEARTLMVRGKYREALAGFEEIAATARSPELAAAAREKAQAIRRELGNRKSKRQPS